FADRVLAAQVRIVNFDHLPVPDEPWIEARGPITTPHEAWRKQEDESDGYPMSPVKRGAPRPNEWAAGPQRGQPSDRDSARNERWWVGLRYGTRAIEHARDSREEQAGGARGLLRRARQLFGWLLPGGI